MLTYDLSGRGKLPLYEYLYRCIRDDICAGRLAANEKLPSKRTLADHLRVSVVTVENAYAQLLLEGYITSVEKRGYFVAPELATTAFPTASTSFSASSTVRDTLSVCPLPTDTPYSVDLNNNTPNAAMFPFATWSKLMRRILSEKATHLLEKSPCGGILALREAICSHLSHYLGMEASPEQVIIGAGTEYLYLLLLQLLGKENIYGLEDPGYKKIAHVYESNGAECVFLPLDENGLCADALAESRVDVLHISPTHHFPTGITMPVTRRKQLLHWVTQEPHRYIIEDDYDSEFCFTGIPLPTLQSIDGAEHVIYMNTFSKTMAPGIRISYMILPPHLTKKYYENFRFYTCPVSAFEQYTLAAFITSGTFEKHLNRMRIHYRKQRNLVLETIREVFAGERVYTVTEPHAGLHFLFELHTRLSSEELIERMLKESIKISCLSEYYRNRQETSFPPKIIINYTNPDLPGLRNALEQFRRIAGRYPSQPTVTE